MDDEQDILDSLQVGLSSFLPMPLTVDVALSAAEARTWLGQHRCDMVIADEKMPAERGTALLAWMRHAHPGVARVLMSAYAPASIDVSGAAPCLVLKKPFDLETMVVALQQTLEQLPRAAKDGTGATTR